MADLGLSQLGDDQLINLLNEAVMEILSRDPVVQKVAQSGVLAIADKRTAFMEVVQAEVASAKTQYIESIKMDVRKDVAKAIQSGELNIGGMVGSATEAKIVVECTKEQIKLMEIDLKRAPEKSSFVVRYDGNTSRLVCSYHSAGQNFDANRDLTVNPGLRESVRKAVLGAFGIPDS